LSVLRHSNDKNGGKNRWSFIGCLYIEFYFYNWRGKYSSTSISTGRGETYYSVSRPVAVARYVASSNFASRSDRRRVWLFAPVHTRSFEFSRSFTFYFIDILISSVRRYVCLRESGFFSLVTRSKQNHETDLRIENDICAYCSVQYGLRFQSNQNNNKCHTET